MAASPANKLIWEEIMTVAIVREQLFNEIQRIPEDRLAEVYAILQVFSRSENNGRSENDDILHLAGAWKDMPDDDFDEFMNEISTRRRQAFSQRPNREASID